LLEDLYPGVSYILKLLLIGDTEVGKTSLLKAYMVLLFLFPAQWRVSILNKSSFWWSNIARTLSRELCAHTWRGFCK